MRYNRGRLRKSIEGLTEAERSESLDNFPKVRKDFAPGQKGSERTEIILNYFEDHEEEVDEFLEAIKKLNPKAYDKYFTELKIYLYLR
jgi:hypothetical protein